MSITTELSDEEFRAAMKVASWKEPRWAFFMEDDVIDRTDAALLDLIAELTVQLLGVKATEDPEWARHTLSLKIRLIARKAQVNARIKEMNRAETASVESMEKKWGAFALALAEAVEDSAADYVLDEVFITSGQLSARDWLHARRAQTAAKARRAAA